MLVIVLLLAAVATYLFVTRSNSSENQQDTQIYHGGECDDPAYYNSHVQVCAIQ